MILKEKMVEMGLHLVIWVLILITIGSMLYLFNRLS